MILYWLDQAQRDCLSTKVRLDGEIQGSFTTRTSHRPNSIGVSVVRLLKRDGNNLSVVGLDCLDGTSLLDVKDYIANHDDFFEATIVW